MCYQGGLEKTKPGLGPAPAGLSSLWRPTPVPSDPGRVSETAAQGLEAETPPGTQPRRLQSQRLYLARNTEHLAAHLYSTHLQKCRGVITAHTCRAHHPLPTLFEARDHWKAVIFIGAGHMRTSGPWTHFPASLKLNKGWSRIQTPASSVQSLTLTALLFGEN